MLRQPSGPGRMLEYQDFETEIKKGGPVGSQALGASLSCAAAQCPVDE